VNDVPFEGESRHFPETPWSQLLELGDPANPNYGPNLDRLIHQYWMPVYHYVRSLRPVGVTDAALLNLSGVKSLEEIELSEIWLTYDGGFKHLAALPRLKKLSLPQVIASEEDVKKLKADLPNLIVTWTKPDEATTGKTKAAFLRPFEKQKK